MYLWLKASGPLFLCSSNLEGPSLLAKCAHCGSCFHSLVFSSGVSSWHYTSAGGSAKMEGKATGTEIEPSIFPILETSPAVKVKVMSIPPPQTSIQITLTGSGATSPALGGLALGSRRPQQCVSCQNSKASSLPSPGNRATRFLLLKPKSSVPSSPHTIKLQRS